VKSEASQVLYEDELDAVAPGLTSLVGIWANPVINLAAVTILALTSGWTTALVALCAWLISVLFWLILSRLQRYIQTKQNLSEIAKNQLISQMLQYIQTFKINCWELDCVSKIESARKTADKATFQNMFIQAIGSSVFSNIGLVAISVILAMQKANLENESISMMALALLYYLFAEVNCNTSI